VQLQAYRPSRTSLHEARADRAGTVVTSLLLCRRTFFEHPSVAPFARGFDVPERLNTLEGKIHAETATSPAYHQLWESRVHTIVQRLRAQAQSPYPDAPSQTQAPASPPALHRYGAAAHAPPASGMSRGNTFEPPYFERFEARALQPQAFGAGSVSTGGASIGGGGGPFASGPSGGFGGAVGVPDFGAHALPQWSHASMFTAGGSGGGERQSRDGSGGGGGGAAVGGNRSPFPPRTESEPLGLQTKRSSGGDSVAAAVGASAVYQRSGDRGSSGQCASLTLLLTRVRA
jgi:hypothetical protein